MKYFNEGLKYFQFIFLEDLTVALILQGILLFNPPYFINL